jgi:hypothetical protein
MKERRKHRRIQTRESAVVVELRYASPLAEEEVRTLFCTTDDLSTHGLRLAIDKAMTPGTPLQITVIFKDPPVHFRHLGTVCWRNAEPESARGQIGVEFLRKTDTDLMEWADFLARHFPEARSGLFPEPRSPRDR